MRILLTVVIVGIVFLGIGLTQDYLNNPLRDCGQMYNSSLGSGVAEYNCNGQVEYVR